MYYLVKSDVTMENVRKADDSRLRSKRATSLWLSYRQSWLPKSALAAYGYSLHAFRGGFISWAYRVIVTHPLKAVFVIGQVMGKDCRLNSR